MEEIKINKNIIGAGHSVYVIAEIGSNFDGDLDRAKYLAKLSKQAGADAFKIQNFLASKIVSEKGFKNLQISFQSKWEKPVTEVYKSAEFPREWVRDISDYCKEIGIDFFSSPYDNEAVDLLEDIGIKAYKIGSGEIDNLEFLEYVAKKQKPVILGCGAATMKEIEEAISVIRNSGNDKIVLLQCVTNYPAFVKDSNIKAMVSFKEKFKTEVGYSDHTIGEEGGGDDPLGGMTVPLGAVALGACIIEKHVTDDILRKGPDHPFAMDFDNFKKMVDGIRAMEKALGDGEKKVTKSEMETVIIQRRGIYAKTDIKEGEIISWDKIEFLRPALALRPAQIKNILGKKAKYNIKSGEPIKPDAI